jgi:hypothetical protein
MPLFDVLVKTIEWTPATADSSGLDLGKTRSCKTLAYNLESRANPAAAHQNRLCAP